MFRSAVLGGVGFWIYLLSASTVNPQSVRVSSAKRARKCNPGQRHCSRPCIRPERCRTIPSLPRLCFHCEVL